MFVWRHALQQIFDNACVYVCVKKSLGSMCKVDVSVALPLSLSLVLLLLSLTPLLGLRASAQTNLISLPLTGTVSMQCNNTLQGPYVFADSHGYVCPTISVNPMTGCCPEHAQRYSCRGCNLSSNCCDSFEYCVSCCLDPKKTATEKALSSRISRQATAKTYSHVFEYCLGRCRHNSDSVVHENAYASEEHHCFFLQANPTEQVKTVEENDLMDISIVIGRQGQSCDSACQGRGQLCKFSKLTILNKCSVLEKQMGCKGVCIASMGSDYPAQVVSIAPRHLQPGACLFSSENSLLSCSGAHPYTRRLCPCA